MRGRVKRGSIHTLPNVNESGIDIFHRTFPKNECVYKRFTPYFISASACTHIYVELGTTNADCVREARFHRPDTPEFYF